MTDVTRLLTELDLDEHNLGACTGTWITPDAGRELVSINPSNGEPIAKVLQCDEAAYDRVVKAAVDAFPSWRMLPAPMRGEIVRELGLELRAKKDALGRLVSLEMGKILAEGLGEVQEMIDICDFAVGLSRQLYGNTMQSERPDHRMFEQWHPLGVVGVITAFNFPVAVWSWNAALAAVAFEPEHRRQRCVVRSEAAPATPAPGGQTTAGKTAAPKTAASRKTASTAKRRAQPKTRKG